ncbi:MAG TPA: hypothetical protein VGD63_07590 [Steroidobacteraceae bacterium]
MADRTRWRMAIVFSVFAALAWAPLSHAAASIFDPAQLPTVRGVITQFTLIPRGSTDGFFLDNGTQVLAVPLFSADLIKTLHSGDAVTIYGLKATGDKALVMALIVIDDQSNQSVLLGDIPLQLAMGQVPHHEHPPAGHDSATPSSTTAPTPASAPRAMHGRVKLPIYGPRGDVSGALLDDGTVLRVASTEGARVAPFLRAGSVVWARGLASESPLGKLLLVEAIGPSEKELQPIGPWDGPQ